MKKGEETRRNHFVSFVRFVGKDDDRFWTTTPGGMVA